jgi:hypothetical protein
MEPNTYTPDQWREDYDWFHANVLMRAETAPLPELHARMAEYFQNRYKDDHWFERHRRFSKAVSFCGRNMAAFDSRNIASVGRGGANISALLVFALWAHFTNASEDQLDEDPDTALILSYAESMRDQLDKLRPGWDKGR